MSEKSKERRKREVHYSKLMSLRLPECVFAALAVQAKERRLSVSEVIRRLLVLGLDDVLFAAAPRH